jgi:transcriptional regulator with XRE-family HTH domain
MRPTSPTLAPVSDPTTAWVAKRIREAREDLGLTQAALAERLDCTQTAVSYWEAGKRKPNLDDVIDLGEALDRDVDYFLPPASVRQPIATALRAELSRTGSDELQRAIESVLARTESAAPPARTLSVGARQPGYAATELLERAGVHEPPVPVDALVGRCGVLLHSGKLPDPVSGILIELAEGAVIAVNSRHVNTRQRFTIAHELGHHLLAHTDRFHVNLGDGAPPEYNYRLERAANEFAADLLMPRSLVAPAFEKNQNTSVLADMFDVSDIAMGYRLVNLGLR